MPAVRKCCVISCPNNKNNCANVQFYNFPVVFHKREQRKNRSMHPDGSKWEPTKNEFAVCILLEMPNQIISSVQATHERFMKRRNAVKKLIVQNSINVFVNKENVVDEQVNEYVDPSSMVHNLEVDKTCSQECQVDFLTTDSEPCKMFICNRNCIKWIDKDCVQGMLPESFKPKYPNVQIIIDCTEFPIDMPSGIDSCSVGLPTIFYN
ncbi:hypothetical protein TSAR_003000 [Trichomalopsis sarcophagae]|uniref:THAP-type domain-containing protein n=1 Tax=Trichomalopsis sarcophagae TaxID=543379 RepID=A0A232EEV5_9HYME|nr:hypothetical protein TSAR_003000 [Trichomalopsis sarcophagae]